MDLKNSTILITGGSSGIGLEMVKQLSEQGSKIIITGRNLDNLKETKKKFPEVHIFQSDVSKPQDIEELYKAVTRQFSELNIIINNAGLMRLIDVQDQTLDLENINREIATNLSGTVQMTHRFLPHLLRKKSAAIVNVSSAIAFMPFTIAPIYSATKAGIHAYTQALRLQLEETNVKVLEIIPPGVNTNLQNGWVIQPKESQMMDVDKMVNIIIKGLSKDKTEIMPPLIRVIKLASRLIPGLLIRFGHGEFKNFKKINHNNQN